MSFRTNAVPLSRTLPRELARFLPFKPVNSNRGLARASGKATYSLIRYQLDSLGWYQFEWLVQVLLKACVGLGVESWGGSGDQGNDAYAPGPLPFPGKQEQSGPFVFQMKFVQDANAAGANPSPGLLKAVRAEAARIKDRMNTQAWKQPAHYALFTNAPLSKTVRDRVEVVLQQQMPSTGIYSFGGNDICDLLDIHQGIRRSFPQLLSLRDLDEIITDAVNSDVLEKGKTIVQLARDLLPLFVPTGPYEKVRQLLHNYNFAVLTGPPEMGKTAIAWVVALTELSLGWEVAICDDPDEFFGFHKPTSKQLFVADDAFGRTEYDPSRGSKWERNLHLILKRLDHQHRLVLTSRKHILERAKAQMDLQGQAERFPEPAQVLVEAGNLTSQEKALMLYRHAKAAHLEDLAKALVREHAQSIVANPSFTPERIRRFVAEVLPSLATSRGDPRSSSVVKAIREAIENPTRRMRTTFAALSSGHKAFLIALLEAGSNAGVEEIHALFARHAGPESAVKFEQYLEELSEAFVTVREVAILGNAKRISWIHPSYRDLVIEELTGDPSLRTRFLAKMGASGIALALSEAGGPSGDRVLPLLVLEDDWKRLEGRCVELINELSNEQVSRILQAVSNAVRKPYGRDAEARLTILLGRVCMAARDRFDSNGFPLGTLELESYVRASVLVRPLPPMPRLQTTWEAKEQQIIKAAQEEEAIRAFDDWANLVESIRDSEPRFLRQVGFPEESRGTVEHLIEFAEAELNTYRSPVPLEEAGEDETRLSEFEFLEWAAGYIETLAATLRRVGALASPGDPRIEGLLMRLESRGGERREEAAEFSPEEDSYDQDYRPARVGSVTISALFEDL